jgi:hypothetical protein
LSVSRCRCTVIRSKRRVHVVVAVVRRIWIVHFARPQTSCCFAGSKLSSQVVHSQNWNPSTSELAWLMGNVDPLGGWRSRDPSGGRRLSTNLSMLITVDAPSEREGEGSSMTIVGACT